MRQQPRELKNTNYELFVAGASALSIVNLFLMYVLPDPTVAQTVRFLDRLLSILFLADFGYRVVTAERKGRYFFRQAGWADLLASMPFPEFKIVRLFRMVRAARLMRKYGAGHMLRTVMANRAQSVFLSVLLLVMLVLEFGGMGMVWAEASSPDGNIKTAGDALWYIWVTIATVGYGDRYPVTPTGRMIGMMIIAVGVGLFGTFTGFMANAFLSPRKGTPAGAPAAAGSEDAKARLAELQRLLAEQQQIQAALQAKIAELEALL